MVAEFGVVNVFGQVFSKTYTACTTNAVVAKGLFYIERQCDLCIALVQRLVGFVSIFLRLTLTDNLIRGALQLVVCCVSICFAEGIFAVFNLVCVITPSIVTI